MATSGGELVKLRELCGLALVCCGLTDVSSGFSSNILIAIIKNISNFDYPRVRQVNITRLLTFICIKIVLYIINQEWVAK